MGPEVGVLAILVLILLMIAAWADSRQRRRHAALPPCIPGCCERQGSTPFGPVDCDECQAAAAGAAHARKRERAEAALASARRNAIGPGAAVALLLALALPAAADTNPASTPAKCAAEDPNCAEATMSLTFAGMATITGETPTVVKPTAFIEGEIPLPVAHGPAAADGSRETAYLGRAFVRLGISTSPGAATDAASVLTDPQNFQSVEGGGGILRYLGQTPGGISKWAVLFEVGFKTRRGGDPLKPVQSSTTYFGAGFRFSHASGSQVTIIGGQDGELGDTGAAQVMVYGSLVLPKTAGVAAIVVDSAFSFFAPTSVSLEADGSIAPTLPPPGGALRSSIVRVGIAADLTAARTALGILGASKGTTPTSTRNEVTRRPAIADAAFGPPAPSGVAR